MSLGLKLRQIRKEKKLSQIEVAEKANVAVNSIRLYEANKRQPRMDQLQKIASALSIPVTDLLTIEEEHETEDKKMDNRYTVFLCNGNFRDIVDRKADYIRFDEVNQEELDVLLRIVRRHNRSNDESIDLVIQTLN